MLAAGAAACLLPPTAKASDHREVLAPASEEPSAWELCCAGKRSYCACSPQALSLHCRCRVLGKLHHLSLKVDNAG